jgi:hypothetical protein
MRGKTTTFFRRPQYLRVFPSLYAIDQRGWRHLFLQHSLLCQIEIDDADPFNLPLIYSCSTHQLNPLSGLSP